MRYYKNGKVISETADLVADSVTIFNPTHEDFISNGYTEYRESEEEKIARLRKRILQEAIQYSNSETVRVFVIGCDIFPIPSTENLSMYQKQGIVPFELEQVKPEDMSEIVDRLIQFNTAVKEAVREHIRIIREMNDKSDLENYDYTSGYPNRVEIIENGN